MESSGIQESKRTRSANYSRQEKNTLLTLVNKYRSIIENKKTDSASNHEKEVTWRKIAHEFNSISPANNFRDAQSLKKTYSNLKMFIRKKAAYERVQRRRAEGGSEPKGDPENDGVRELALDTINTERVFGLPNVSDCDSFMASKDNDETDLGNEENEVILLEVENKVEAENCFNANEDISTNSNTSENNQFAGRSAASVPCSSELRKAYHQLALERLEVTRAKKQLLLKRLEHEDEQNKLKCEILKEELKLKQRLNNSVSDH